MSNGYYLFSCSNVNKSTSSAVAMASYRSGESLYSERDGETKRYKEREVKPETFILKPNNAPEWTLDREKLWNEVEKYEKRDNSRLAKNILLGLPNDLTDEQQLELVKEYVQENFVDKGMVADVAIHRDDMNNPHAHILLTNREFDENGKWNPNKSIRVPVLDENGKQKLNDKGWKVTKSVKINDWDKKETLVKWRENWAELLNKKSLEYGTGKTYSSESYADQGLEKKATQRLERNHYQFEKKLEKEQGKEYKPKTYLAKKNIEIKKYNASLDNVVDLMDYKSQKEMKSILNNYRKSVHKNPEIIEATNLLVQRIKGYVDYGVSLKLMNEFNESRNKWFMKLETTRIQLKNKENLYKHILKLYKENPKNVEKYGYSKENFEEQIKIDVSKLNKEKSNYESQLNKFNELKEAARISLNYQTELLNNEFEMVYGDDKEFDMMEKYFAMELLKKHDILLPKEMIKEEYLTRSNDFDKFNNHIPIWKQVKQTMTSISIYNRTIEKLKSTNLNEIDDPKETIIKLKTYTELKNEYENYIKSVEPIIDNELKEKGFEIKDLNTETKVAILEEYSNLNSQEISNLDHNELLKKIHDKQIQYNEQLKGNYENENESEKEIYNDLMNHSKKIIENIINAIVYEHSNPNDMSRTKSKTRKPKRQRGGDGREL